MRKRREAVAAVAPELPEEFKDPPPPGMDLVPPDPEEKPGRELRDALNGRDIFDHARPRLPEPAALDPEFDRIIESIQIEEPFAVYKMLEEELQVGEKRSDHGSLNFALDKAETNLRTAHRLWVTSVVEKKRFQLEQDLLFAAMRHQVTATLQAEKTSGTRSKMITEGDINAQMQAEFPEAYREAEMKKTSVELMEKSMANLVESWASRCRTLQTMLGKSR